MRDVEQDQAGHLTPMLGGVQTDDQATKRVPNQQIGARNLGRLEQSMQIGNGVLNGARALGRVAPSKAGTIVDQRARKRFDLAREIGERLRVAFSAALEHDGRRSTAEAPEGELIVADTNLGA